MAQHGVAVQVFEAAAERERTGSRAICMQRESLEIWARLDVGERVAQRGVQWRVGRTYYRGRELFTVELPTHDEHFPPFVNISQSEVEELLEVRLRELDVPIHRGHRLTNLVQDADGVSATFEADAGAVTHRSGYLVGTDGAHSTVRHAAGVGFPGYTFDDRFLIADIRAQLRMTNERHFHFDPPWNPGRQVLIHPQPDGVWRIDWQVPPETDVDAERTDGGLERRIRAVIGDATPYELAWVTGYRFSQRVADAFRDRRVFLAGDAAHVMSPFGARGLNSGVADAENLAWKVAAVVHGGPDRLLDTYEAERRPAAMENIRATDATMRFMAPHGPWRKGWRNLVLRLAPHAAWFRARVNSGRLAEPASYAGLPTVAPGPEDQSLPRHGEVAPDVALPGDGRLRERLGRGFAVVLPDGSPQTAVDPIGIGADTVYGPDRAWLIRPDGYIADSAPVLNADELLASAPSEFGIGCG